MIVSFYESSEVMSYTYDRRPVRANHPQVTFEFPTADAAADFTERINSPSVRKWRVVEVELQGGDIGEARQLVKELRGREIR
jgi:hypothetical protein